MFRLFLVNLLQSAQDSGGNPRTPAGQGALPPKRLRNRRVFERFDIDHKHLSLMNDQDILLIRDLSANGFSTEVSERGFRRLLVGDTYLCRIRYLQEVYELHAVVRWKSKGFVGFELADSSGHKVRSFMLRLLRPVEIGTSLQKVADRFIQLHDNEGLDWYHGIDGTNFFLWTDGSGELRSWKLEVTDRFISWKPDRGIRTGSLLIGDDSGCNPIVPWEQLAKEDKVPDPTLGQLAADIFMAAPVRAKDALLKSIME